MRHVTIHVPQNGGLGMFLRRISGSDRSVSRRGRLMENAFGRFFKEIERRDFLEEYMPNSPFCGTLFLLMVRANLVMICGPPPSTDTADPQAPA
jgi:hypothetical protein